MKRWILLLLCLMLCGCQSVQEETAEKPQNGIAEAAREGIEVISHDLPEKKEVATLPEETEEGQPAEEEKEIAEVKEEEKKPAETEKKETKPQPQKNEEEIITHDAQKPDAEITDPVPPKEEPMKEEPKKEEPKKTEACPGVINPDLPCDAYMDLEENRTAAFRILSGSLSYEEAKAEAERIVNETAWVYREVEVTNWFLTPLQNNGRGVYGYALYLLHNDAFIQP